MIVANEVGTTHVGDIFMTRNYGMFKHLKENRSVTDARCKVIKDSIDNVGLMPAPIIVNEKYEIIDGQGRFKVCEQNDLPIYYTIVNGIGVDECIAMNTSTTRWKQKDFVYSHAESGKQSYVFLKEMLQNHPNIPLAVAVPICLNKNTFGPKEKRDLRDGVLYIKPDDYDKIRDMLEYLDGLVPYVDKIHGHKDLMFLAIYWAITKGGAGKERIASVLGGMAIEAETTRNAVGSIKNALFMLENAYNKNLSKTNKVRLLLMYESQNY